MATIQNETARRLMYYWHGGMGSAFYAAASSGLVASFAELAAECATIDEPDRARLMSWIQKRQAKFKTEIVYCGRAYRVLPWVSRSYFGNTEGRK